MDKNYFSGVSNWTKASTVPKKFSLQLDSESLEAQLDRLNSTLLGLLHLDSKDFDSFSFKDSNDSSIHSYLPTEPNEKTPEHLQMICEDFRSHELRSYQKFPKTPLHTCQLVDLYNTYSDLCKSIELIEKGLSKTVEFNVAGFEVKLLIDNGFVLAGKEKICAGFGERIGKSESAYMRQLENEVEELRGKVFRCRQIQELDEMMFKSFSESFGQTKVVLRESECQRCRGSATQTSLEVETRLTSTLNTARKQMLVDLDWEVSTTKMLKSVYETKVHDLDEKEKTVARQVQDISNELQKKCKLLEREKNRFFKEQEKLKKSNLGIKELVKEIRIEIQVLREKTKEVEQPLVIRIPTPCSTPKQKIEESDELVEVEQEIASLEKELLTASDKNSVQFRINKLKTKLSTLRSAKILHTCTNKKRTRSFGKSQDLVSATSKASTFFNFSVPIEKIESTNKEILKPSAYKPNLNIESTPLPTNRQVCADFSKEDNLFTFLQLKESRLRKKEEEIIKQELKLQHSWMKLPNANDLIPILRTELDRYLNLNESLYKTQAELDSLIKSQLDQKKSQLTPENSFKADKTSEKIKAADKFSLLLTKLEQLLSKN